MRLAITLMLVPVFCVGAKKDRDWRDGTVVESASEKITQTTGSQTTGRVDPATGNVSATTTNNQRSYDEDSYVVDAGDRFYVVSESIPRLGGGLVSLRVKKGARLVPGNAVKFAVDRDSIFIQSDGKEVKLHIRRVMMKPRP